MELIPHLKKGKRTLSEFMARELLYDFATQNLDPQRKQAVQEAIENHPNLGKELDDILYGITYCKHLSQTRTKDEMYQKMLNDPFTFRDAKKSLNVRNWNAAYQWVAETLFVSFVFVIIVLFVPWQKWVYKIIDAKKSDISLTEMKKEKAFRSVEEENKIAIKNHIEEPNIDRKYHLKVANPNYTINKFQTIINKMGASLVDTGTANQPLNQIDNSENNDGKDEKNDISKEKIFVVSVPQNKLDPLINELKTHGEFSVINMLNNGRSQGDLAEPKPILTIQIVIGKMRVNGQAK